MNENIKNEEAFDSVCDGVRFAISVGDELTEEQKKHLDECDECRTFFEQSKIMSEELAAMGSVSLTKNGKTLADSVMEEIARQELFTKGPAKKSKFAFFTRHAGLIAAGIALVIMAVPLVQNILNSENKDYITSSDAHKRTRAEYGADGYVKELETATNDTDGSQAETVEEVAYPEEKPLNFAFYAPSESASYTSYNNEAAREAVLDALEAELNSMAENVDHYVTSHSEKSDLTEIGDEVVLTDSASGVSGGSNGNLKKDAYFEVKADSEDDFSVYLQEESAENEIVALAPPPAENSTLGYEKLAGETVEAYLADKAIRYDAVTLLDVVDNGSQLHYVFTVSDNSGEKMQVTVVLELNNGEPAVKDVFEG